MLRSIPVIFISSSDVDGWCLPQAIVGGGTVYVKGDGQMRRETWMLASAVMALILGGCQAKAATTTYGFLYNGTTYTTLAPPEPRIHRAIRRLRRQRGRGL